DQDKLLPRLMSFLEPDGMLAFQVPCNFNEPSHKLIRDVATEGPWAPKLTNVRNLTFMTPLAYFEILEPLSSSLDIWETEYLQVLDGDDPVYRWVSGTGLRPFVQALRGEERESFIAEYKKRVAAAYPMRAPGKTLFPFKRLFVVAKK
ncbi:MAG TPA: trans-aconitate 2-methyltransferase, partial [Rhizomicrobium sp.]|nr:trans-aconitate 2-methyltransferase [Rhizomicrobium sp.]